MPTPPEAIRLAVGRLGGDPRSGRRAPAPPSCRPPRSRCRGSGAPRARSARRRRRSRRCSLVSVQPAREALPSRVSIETTTRSPWASSARSRKSGSRSAAVPITTRVGAGLEHRGDRLRVAQPAPDLDRAPDRRRDPPHRIQVPGRAGPGAVEVDDVEELGPFARPADGGVDGVGVVGGLALVVALQQAHGAGRRGCLSPGRGSRPSPQAGTAAQIPAKLESSRRPAALDFSGWNWTPKTLSRCAAQQKRSP